MNVTLEQIIDRVKAEGHYFSIYADANDRWNSPSVYVTRQYGDAGEELTKMWRVNISHSSSSSSAKNVDAILQTGLMVAQLNECIAITQLILNNLGSLEEAWQAKRLADKAEAEAEQARKQAIIDADTQITARAAATMVALMAVAIKHEGKYKVAKKLRHRGSTNRFARLVARSTGGGAVQFKLNNTVVPKSKLDALITEYAEIVDAETVA